MTEFGSDYMSVLNSRFRNAFWEDVFKSWSDFSSRAFDKENALLEPIWYNNKLLVGEKTIFVESWYKKGIKILKDLLRTDGNIYSMNELQQIFELPDVCFFAMQ